MSESLLFILLLCAVAIGWGLGRIQARRDPNRITDGHQDINETIIGLNYRLSEQPDQALDHYIKTLEVNNQTVDTHLAIGHLFRTRGEIDKAIRIHQHLLAQPVLEPEAIYKTQYHLAQDYLECGLLDRAERLLIELIRVGEYAKQSCLWYLLDIYQKEQEWHKAIVIAKQLKHQRDRRIDPVLSHYYCELATQLIQQGVYSKARKKLQLAYQCDPSNVRVSLLQADIDYHSGRNRDAIKALKRIKQQNIAYVSESLTQLMACYQQLEGQERELMKYLNQCLDELPSVSIMLAIAERLKTNSGEKAAFDYIADKLKQRPSIRGLDRFIALYVKRTKGVTQRHLHLLHQLTQQLLEEKPVYRCQECGFATKKLHWLCPSCKSWGAIEPIHGLEGD